SKYIDPVSRLAAVRVLNCSPWELLDHEEQESARDEAEGVRVAYVAATRARDLLVVPAIGDGSWDGWLSPLNKAIFPTRSKFRNSTTAPECPSFGEATVLLRPLEHEGPHETSVKPGLHKPECGGHDVVWWDPGILKLDVEPHLGLHYEDILAPDQNGRADESIRHYEAWKVRRTSSLEKGSNQSFTVFIATDAPEPPPGYADRVQIIRVERAGSRQRGARFGSLVHLILRDAPLIATKNSLVHLARTHGRLLAASDDEVKHAATAVSNALQ